LLDTTRMDVSALDDEARGSLAEVLEIREGTEGPHLKGCQRAAGAVLEVRWHDVVMRLDSCCDDALTLTQVRHDALQLLYGALADEVDSREDVCDFRRDLEVALASSPELEPLRRSLSAHISRLETEHERWLRTKGGDALELLASWYYLHHLDPLADHYLKDPGRAPTAEELPAVGSNRALLRTHAQRPRHPGRILGKAHVNRTSAASWVVGDAALVDALDDFNPGKRAWVLPGALVPLLEREGASWVALEAEDGDDVLEAALVLLDEDEDLSAARSLEVARAL
jgi:hypothetical protein